MIRRQLFFEIVLNGFLPWLLFLYLTESLHWSEFHGLLATTIIPSIVGLVEFVRERRIDAISIVSLASIVVGLVMTAATSDTRLLLVRESYLTLILGVIFLFSVWLGRPVLFVMALCQSRRQGGEDSLRLAWEDPRIRRFFVVVTIAWGVTLVGEFLAKILLIRFLPVAQVLAWSPVVLYGMTGVAALGTLIYSYHVRRSRSILQ